MIFLCCRKAATQESRHGGTHTVPVNKQAQEIKPNNNASIYKQRVVVYADQVSKDSLIYTV